MNATAAHSVLTNLPSSHLHLAHLRLRFQALADLRLPSYPGSALRSGFGHAFRKVVCTMGPIPCETCLLRSACPYYQLFEAPVPANAPMLLQKTGHVPHAFIITPDTSRKRFVAGGESFTAKLTLLGPAIRSLPYFLMAFQLFGQAGLGRAKNQFALANAEALSFLDGVHEAADTSSYVSYYDGATGLAPGLPPILNLMLKTISASQAHEPLTSIQIHLQTPLRLKARGELVTQLTAREFFFNSAAA